MFIDLTKAFDCINHELLLKKFRKLQFSEKFLLLLESYLNDRLQCVDVDGIKSPMLKIKTGVFKGSKLAAVCFLIYINFIFSLPTSGKANLFADDDAIAYGATSLEELKSQMETDLKILKIFFDNHFLKINASKTKYILFFGKTSLGFFTEQNLNIDFDGEKIERVQV